MATLQDDKVAQEALRKREASDRRPTVEAFRDLKYRLSRFQQWVVSVLVLGITVVIIGVATLFIDFGALKFSYYKHAKNTNTQKALVDNLQDQQAVITSIQSLEKKIEELKSSIGITKAISDVANGQKLLTNSVEDLKEELNELKILYRIEKNTTDIINSQKILVNSFQSLEKEVRKLTALSQDDIVPNMIGKAKITDDSLQNIKEELINMSQRLEQLKQRLHRN